MKTKQTKPRLFGLFLFGRRCCHVNTSFCTRNILADAYYWTRERNSCNIKYVIRGYRICRIGKSSFAALTPFFWRREARLFNLTVDLPRCTTASTFKRCFFAGSQILIVSVYSCCGQRQLSGYSHSITHHVGSRSSCRCLRAAKS